MPQRVGRWAVISASLGAIVWLAAPLFAFEQGCVFAEFGSIEHTFLFLPLVAMPLALELLSRLLDGQLGASTTLARVERWAQPLAAGFVVASYCLQPGTTAGALVVPWLAFSLLLMLGNVWRAAAVRRRELFPHVSIVAAHLFLLVGAVWLLLSRLGATPGKLASLTVFLAALHFHFSGFLLQVVMASTGMRLHDPRAWLTRGHRFAAVAAIAGIPMLAVGNIQRIPSLKFAGVTAMVIGTLGLAAGLVALARSANRLGPRVLLALSACALAAAMALAGVYGFAELTRRDWLTIPQMVAMHGGLNVLGFALCGLLGHLLFDRAHRN